MLEIEMKFPVVDFAAIEAIVAGWQTQADEPIDEADHYFNAPDRDFAKTDEAFRLRRIGERNRLTYKGPKSPGLAKTRTEIEIPLGEGSAIAADTERLLVHLGYRPVAVVRKSRRILRFRRDGFDLELCLDDVVNVGRFVEVEIVTTPEKRSDAERVLQTVASALHLDKPERRSYLEMLLEKLSTKLTKPHEGR